LLTQEADPEIEAARRFYGKLTNGKVHCRSIELRRHDYPPFMKRFQEQLLSILLGADEASDVQKRQLPKAVEFTVQAVDELRLGNVPLNELVISKVLRMPVERYRSLFPHVTAAIQLRQKHRPVRAGDFVDYVYVDTKQVNPVNHVAPAEFATTYDVEKYAEMLLDVAESILGVFGFSRTRLGFQNRSRNFLDELRSEMTKEILTELEGLQP
jgi:DNA polymerase elongation subunit (family B)